MTALDLVCIITVTIPFDATRFQFGRRRSFEVAQTSVNILDHNDPPSLMLTILPQKGFYVGGSFRFLTRTSPARDRGDQGHFIPVAQRRDVPIRNVLRGGRRYEGAGK